MSIFFIWDVVFFIGTRSNWVFFIYFISVMIMFMFSSYLSTSGIVFFRSSLIIFLVSIRSFSGSWSNKFNSENLIFIWTLNSSGMLVTLYVSNTNLLLFFLSFILIFDINSMWTVPHSAPGLVLADRIQLPHFYIGHLMMSMCTVIWLNGLVVDFKEIHELIFISGPCSKFTSDIWFCFIS